MKALILTTVFVSCAIGADKPSTSVFQMVTSKQIGGAPIDKWFETAREWYTKKDFPDEIQRFGPGIIPVLVECFDDRIMDQRLSTVLPEKRKDEIERIRISAMYCFMALGEKASSAVPELVRHLENRTSAGRGDFG